MNRNLLGVICWSVLTAVLIVAYTFINKGAQAVVIPTATCLVAMTIREIWQYKTGRAKFFEYDDIALYTFTITFSGVLCGLFLAMLGVIR